VSRSTVVHFLHYSVSKAAFVLPLPLKSFCLPLVMHKATFQWKGQYESCLGHWILKEMDDCGT